MKEIPISGSEKLTACHRQDANTSTLLCISALAKTFLTLTAYSLHYKREHGCLIHDCELQWAPRNLKLLILLVFPLKNPF